MNELVSIILSVYNAEKYIKDCVNSIINQSYKNLEIIIIDDNSKDKSYDILSQYQDKRIKLYKNFTNNGLTKNLNFAIEKSSGDFIARMDADDICCKDRIEKQLFFLLGNKNVGVVGSNAYLINEENKVVGITDVSLADDEIKCKMTLCNPLVHPTVMVRKDIIKRYMYNELYRTCQDFELWVRMKNEVYFENLKEPLIFYRLNSKGVSKTERQDINKREAGLESIIKESVVSIGANLPDKDIAVLTYFTLGYIENKELLIRTYNKIRSTELDEQMSMLLVRFLKFYLVYNRDIKVFANGIMKYIKYIIKNANIIMKRKNIEKLLALSVS